MQVKDRFEEVNVFAALTNWIKQVKLRYFEMTCDLVNMAKSQIQDEQQRERIIADSRTLVNDLQTVAGKVTEECYFDSCINSLFDYVKVQAQSSEDSGPRGKPFLVDLRQLLLRVDKQGKRSRQLAESLKE